MKVFVLNAVYSDDPPEVTCLGVFIDEKDAGRAKSETDAACQAYRKEVEGASRRLEEAFTKWLESLPRPDPWPPGYLEAWRAMELYRPRGSKYFCLMSAAYAAGAEVVAILRGAGYRADDLPAFGGWPKEPHHLFPLDRMSIHEVELTEGEKAC